MDVEPLQVRIYPDPVLMQIATPVGDIDEGIRALAGRMIDLMYAADGIGLAAPQVGVPKRIFVTRDPDDENRAIVWINPILEVIDEDMVCDSEGCLSLPDIDVNVQRPTGIRIRGEDLDGREMIMESCEHIARVWQHECDHLDGRLIIDRMSTMDRLRCRRAIRALVERGG
jgi:peptide deformylase